jgi:hypothetical protein
VVIWIGDKKKRELMSDKLKADPKPELSYNLARNFFSLPQQTSLRGQSFGVLGVVTARAGR